MMSTSRSVRAYVNARGVDVPAGSTALDAVRVFSATEAQAVERGERVITDSRGLPIDGDSAVHAGSIFRLVSGRRGSGASASANRDGD
jgi:hypothetical protein